MTDPWYGDIILHLQTLRYQPIASRDEHRYICHQDKIYLILNDTLYCHGVDSILQHCLTHEEAEIVLNDFHAGACGGHLSRLDIAHKILRVGIFGPLFSKIALKQSRNSHHVKCSPQRNAPIHIHSIPL